MISISIITFLDQSFPFFIKHIDLFGNKSSIKFQDMKILIGQLL